MGRRNFTNLFDGYTKLVRVHLSGNNTSYKSRLLMTGNLKTSLAMGEVAPCITVTEPAPPYTWTEKLMALYRGYDNAYFNVFPFGEDTVSLGDQSMGYIINRQTLETIESHKPYVPGEYPGFVINSPSTAHPVREHNKNTTLTYVTSVRYFPSFLNWLNRASIVVFRVTSFKDREIIAQIPLDKRHIPTMHSFGVSANYAVLFENPSFLDFDMLLKTSTFYSTLQWKPDMPTKVHIVTLKDGKVKTLEMPAYFFAHHVNSYEDGSTIIIDYTMYDVPAGGMKWLFDITSLDNVFNQTKRNAIPVKIELVRITINLETETAELKRHINTTGLEFVNTLDLPAINENCRFGKLCYVYGVAIKTDGVNVGTQALVKKDLCKPGADKAWHQQHYYPYEPWFIPDPQGVQEDDGLLFSLLFDGVKKQSFLGVFNPHNMELINRADMPEIVNFNPHGHFFPHH